MKITPDDCLLAIIHLTQQGKQTTFQGIKKQS